MTAPSIGTVDKYRRAISRLKVNRAHGSASPHKPCMLLAVMSLAEAGQLGTNRINFLPPLFERYALFFQIVRRHSDHSNVYFPYFHLRSDGFWHLHATPGREAVLESMGSARSRRDVEENISYASLDPDLHALLLQPAALQDLRQHLVATWFGDRTDEINSAIEQERSFDYAERELRLSTHAAKEDRGPYSAEPARSVAFRRIVTEAYDYRCAACGWRIILPDDSVLVHAAHLIPFADSRNDDPRNGISLSPTFHWAMDKFIIAPGPDNIWRVSPTLDDRLPDNRPLLELEGKPVILPRNELLRPDPMALQWRVDKLAK